MLNIDELITILKPYGKITIIGHDNIDVDAFFSGLLLSRLLNSVGIESEFVILDKIVKNETYSIVKELSGINMEDYYCGKEDSKRNLFLEDHYKTSHKGKVVGCLDHHFTREEIQYPYLYSRRSCSTSYMVYELMCQAGYKISRVEAKIIIVSMMVDTVAFRSSKTIQSEAVEARKLAKAYGFNYLELEKNCLCLTPLNIPVKSIINNGYKNYEYNGNKVKSSYVQIYEMVAQKKVEEWLSIIKKCLEEEKLKMWVFIIYSCEDNETHVYKVEENGVSESRFTGILSRGIDIMPKVEEDFY